MGISKSAMLFCAATVAGIVGMSALESQAAPITPGNLVVYRVGTGAASLTNAAAEAFIDEYTTAGVFVQTIAVPTTTSGSNRRLTNSGTATSEGALSFNAGYVAFAGYDAAPGTSSVAGTATSTVNRVVGLLDVSTGTIATNTVFSAAFSSSNIRSAVTDGTTVWAVGANSGVMATAIGTTNSSTTAVSTTVINNRVIGIYNNQLYFSTGSGSTRGVYQVGTGLPTTGPVVAANMTDDGSSASPYSFVFADANTLYIADDRNTGSAGGVQKWTFDGSSWTKQYNIVYSATVGVRGLTGADIGGTFTLFGTTTNNKIVSLVDTGASSTYTDLATAGTNTVFRGIAIIPIPEPASLALLAFGSLLLLKRRHA